ncbi:ABC transporter protein, ATP binding component [Oceanicola granulosus HTCC2516]|uniref:ABC transporter protein, ATP binding component n=1 Tax=Oceanicola granulosus (strain ATCC BAA-861 / DSM 15982 / KCTC 12143 / HTCC2516) TaxID=314256 RepID=Q2CH65_OCEGH|nr:sugar ABC transporter ATP-binding protein [Oceanicola granulosus]EAR51946.1 ABC transporter protein, ATP binding component [Oceanicola granulosus HTCC2516]
MAVCEIRHLTKDFGPNRVLRGVDLDLVAGAVTVLMGANGAGKSTLVKVLSGIHAAGGGTVTLDGAPFAPQSPSAAMRAGIATVHQSIDDGVIPDLDVASNLMLDRMAEPGAALWLRGRRMRAEARAIADTMQLDLDVSRPVRDLTLAERQLIAIARAMTREPKVLILDEPTSSLSAREAERLFALIDRVRDQGVAILYISHRMSDIRRIADRIVAMRDGVITGTFTEKPLDTEGAVTAMLGVSMTDLDLEPATPGAPVLTATGLRLAPDAAPFDLTLAKGEVVAVVGLVGSGKSRLASVLYGLERPDAGEIVLNDTPYAPESTAEAIRSGVFLCARDRASNGVVPDFDITRNLTLPFTARHSTGWMLRRRSELAATRDMIDRLGIVCQGPRDAILSLSGGNQQKVMVGRWLSQVSEVLILDEPFQGVDIRARRDIGAHIRETAPERATLVLVAELDEAVEIADRILVLHDFTIVADYRNEGLDLGAVLAAVSGRPAPEAAEGTHTV